MAKKFRKKPVEIEALAFDGENAAEVIEFTEGAARLTDEGSLPDLIISTLEGPMKVSVGDYVIKGVKGEFYPCKPLIFLMTYDEVLEVDMAKIEETARAKYREAARG